MKLNFTIDFGLCVPTYNEIHADVRFFLQLLGCKFFVQLVFLFIFAFGRSNHQHLHKEMQIQMMHICLQLRSL